MSKILLFVLLNFLSLSISAQWLPLGSGLDYEARTLVYDSVSSKLYVGGNFSNAGGVPAKGVAVWDGQSWDSLGSGFQQGAPVYRLFKYRDTLLASSVYFPDPGEGTWLNYWNGSAWDSFPHSTNSVVGAFKEFNNVLYVGGGFSRAGSISANMVFKYSNGILMPLNLPSERGGYNVAAIEFYHDSLFVAGNFYDTVTQTNDLEVWDGNQFQRVGGFSFPFGNSSINSLCTYDDKLFIGGYFHTGYGNFLIKWDGQNFSDAGLGLDGPIWNMKVYDGQLFVCGGFYQIGGIAASGIARWDGQQWHSVVPYFNNTLIADFVLTPVGLYLVGGLYLPGIGAREIVLYTGAVGISENKGNLNISIFPNPAQNVLTVNYGHLGNSMLEFLIYNPVGGLVYSRKDFAGFGREKQIDISDLASGLYILMLRSDDEVVSEKFIIRR